MEWSRAHPYATAYLLAAALVVGGGLLVTSRVAHPSTSTFSAWGGADNALVNSTSYTPNAVLSTVQSPTFSTQQSPVFLPIAPKPSLGETDTSNAFDMNAFIAALSQPASSGESAATTSAGISSYEFIPQGLIATSATTHRTNTQQILYEYGNETGSFIQSYEDQHRDVSQILKDQIEDRQNTQKGQAVKDIGEALVRVGKNLEHMGNVPPSIAPTHLALAKSYEDIGARLALIPDAQGDQALVTAIEAYDAAADTFTAHYVALATFFSLSGVVFALQDSGSVFSFTTGGGL